MKTSHFSKGFKGLSPRAWAAKPPRVDKGFTVIEILISSLLMTLVFAVAMVTFIRLTKARNQIVQDTENLTSLAFAESYMADQLRRAGLSLNVLNLLDDTNENFFDYYSDLPESYIPSSRRTRKLRITAAPGARSEFFLLLRDPSMSLMMYDPSAAYHLATSGPSAPMSFSYAGINYSNQVKTFFGEAWSPGKEFLLLSPILLRPETPSGVNMLIPGRPTYFIGSVNKDGKDLNPVRLPFVRSDDPMDPLVTLDSPDSLFLNLPLAAGSAPLVELLPIQIVRYWLQANTSKPGASLYASPWEGGVQGKSFLLADDVSQLVLTRRSVTSKIIGMQICDTQRAYLCE
ncbi:MAG: hypothetical protein C5B49_00615 [Bdellovibrio sp.]|nr:MAG: hypothetical protein C5B49_00615 [Bdellovibrio sp.]